MQTSPVSSVVSRAVARANQVKRNFNRIAAQALQEKGRRETRERAVQEAQTAREQKLDRQIVLAMRGVSAIVRLCEDSHIQKLIKARDSIGKSVPLYHAYRDGGSAWDFLIADERCGYVWGVHNPRDQEISVDAILHPNEIELYIGILFLGHLDYSGRSVKDDEISTWECKIPLSLPRKGRKEVKSELRTIATSDLSSPWEDWSISPDYAEPVTDALINKIRRGDARLAAHTAKNAKAEYEWMANHVLVRFLMDCSRQERLQEYLELALKRIK